MKGERFVIPAGKIKTVVFDKPLHVRVAEKLGCATRLDVSGDFWWCQCQGGKHRGPGRKTLARYDTDWSATGPLIERFCFDLEWEPSPYGGPGEWEASAWLPLRMAAVTSVKHATGNTALEAVCNLILALPDELVKG